MALIVRTSAKSELEKVIFKQVLKDNVLWVVPSGMCFRRPSIPLCKFSFSTSWFFSDMHLRFHYLNKPLPKRNARCMPVMCRCDLAGRSVRLSQAECTLFPFSLFVSPHLWSTGNCELLGVGKECLIFLRTFCDVLNLLLVLFKSIMFMVNFFFRVHKKMLPRCATGNVKCMSLHKCKNWKQCWPRSISSCGAIIHHNSKCWPQMMHYQFEEAWGPK